MESMCSSAALKSEASDLEIGQPQGSVFLITAGGSILKLPIPSRSSKDPLNWSKWKRTLAFLAILVNSFVGLLVVQAPSVMVMSLAGEFGPDDTRPFSLSILFSAPTLFMGIAALLWIPLTLAWGRRPVYLLSIVLLFLSTLGAGLSTSFSQLLVSVCIQGLAEGINTSAALLMIIDLTFIHERPQYIGATWSIVGALTLASLAVVAQVPEITTTSWRPFYLIWSFPVAVSCLLTFFLYPETYFVRPAVAFEGRILVQSSEEQVKVYEDWENTPGGKGLPDVPTSRIQELKFWRSIRGGGWRAVRACYSQVFLCLVNPLMFWVALLEAVLFGSMLAIGETYSLVLMMEPYSMSPKSTPFVNLAGALGSFLAWPATAMFIPWISKRLTVRNNGVRNAEHYLPAFIMPVIFGALSIILYGITVERKLHHSLIFISYAFNSFSFAALATANILWITEAFPRWAAPGVVVVSGLSYAASFGISFAIMPWAKSQGYELMGIEIGVAILVIGCVGIPVAFWGKALRQYIHGRWTLNQEGALRPQ